MTEVNYERERRNDIKIEVVAIEVCFNENGREEDFETKGSEKHVTEDVEEEVGGFLASESPVIVEEKRVNSHHEKHHLHRSAFEHS